ncbi:MAG: hypothetical protein WAX89_06345 [Alphaproteobacteria bacterium]
MKLYQFQAHVHTKMDILYMRTPLAPALPLCHMRLVTTIEYGIHDELISKDDYFTYLCNYFPRWPFYYFNFPEAAWKVINTLQWKRIPFEDVPPVLQNHSFFCPYNNTSAKAGHWSVTDVPDSFLAQLHQAADEAINPWKHLYWALIVAALLILHQVLPQF